MIPRGGLPLEYLYSTCLAGRRKLHSAEHEWRNLVYVYICIALRCYPA